MSTSRMSRQTVALATMSTLTVVWFGAGSAAADPAWFDDRCAATLAQVTEWPGDIGDGRPHFSDAYDSYLSRQPACRPTA